MQKRSRRPQGIRSRKISVSVTDGDYAVISARAARVHRGNVSAVVHEMVAALKRQEAQDALLATLGGERITDADVQALRDEIAGPARPRRGRNVA